MDSKNDLNYVFSVVKRFVYNHATVSFFLVLSLFIPIFWFGARPEEYRYYWAEGGDGLFVYALIDLVKRGALLYDPKFGFPSGTDWSFYPLSDWTQLGIGAFFDALFGKGSGLPLMYIISFPVTYYLAYLCFRTLHFTRVTSSLVSFSFTFLPWHFLRFGHVLLATTFGVVSGILLLIRVFLANKIYSKKDIALNLLLASITALSGGYFAFYSLVAMLFAVLVTFPAKKYLIHVYVKKIIWPSITAIIFLMSQIPFLLSLPEGESRANVSTRQVFESQLYGGRVINLITPYYETHVPVLRDLLQRARLLPIDSESGLPSNFGSISTTLSFLVFTIYIFFILRKKILYKNVEQIHSHSSEILILSTAFIGLLALFITYGPNLIFSSVITPQFRAWNRMTPILHLLILIISALVLRDFTKRYKFVKNKIFKYTFLITALLIIYFDQLAWIGSGRIFVETGKEKTLVATKYMNKVNTLETSSCPVLQLPIVAFPENPPMNRMLDYEHFFVPLIDDKRSWSYGAMKNTKNDIFAKYRAKQDWESLFEFAQAKGFCLVHIDKSGFRSGKEIQEIEGFLGELLVASEDSNWLMYRIRRG